MRTCLTLLFAPDFRLRLNVKHTMLAEGRLLMIAVLVYGGSCRVLPLYRYVMTFRRQGYGTGMLNLGQETMR